VQLEINDQTHTFEAQPNMPLLWVLREVLHVTGTKFGCGMALCGACTVHVDGQPTRACVTQLSTIASKKITTIEDHGPPTGTASPGAPEFKGLGPQKGLGGFPL
jgi:isoquinoline 1-oxidoreductase subunit alpha